MVKAADHAINALISLVVVPVAAGVIYKLVNRAHEPVLCPDCNDTMDRRYHSIYYCNNCQMNFNMRSDGTYRLDNGMRY